MKYRILLEEKKNSALLLEYKQYVQQLMPYMQKQIGFNRPPTINFLEDEQNAQDPLGRTAHYDPSRMEISVYVTGRHPKDILRSIAHEMVHHAQNCRGDLSPDKVGEAGEGYAQSNEHLRNMEKEAYLLGNMMFRDWEDTHKKGNTIMEKEIELEEEMCEHDTVHPGMTHAAYKRDDKPLEEWKNEELFGLLMKKFGILSEKGSKPDFLDLDKDGDKKEPMKKAAKEKKDDVKEEKMTKGEKKEKERIVKGMKKSKKDFEKRYPGRGEQVMYATATKKAMEK